MHDAIAVLLQALDEAFDRKSWHGINLLLMETHASLRGAVARLSAADLLRRAAGGETTVRALVTGIVAHDLYHAGQIQLLKRLRGRNPRS